MLEQQSLDASSYSSFLSICQNWIYRVVKERKVADNEENQNQPDTSSTDVTAASLSESDDEEKSAEPSLPDDQPVFKGHGEPNQRPKEVNPDDVNPREVHHVVVPYSQWTYQRMYDWPPEPKYARVKIPPPKAPSTSRRSPMSPSSARRKSFFASSDSLRDGNSPISVRRRTVSRNYAYSGNSGSMGAF